MSGSESVSVSVSGSGSVLGSARVSPGAPVLSDASVFPSAPDKSAPLPAQTIGMARGTAPGPQSAPPPASGILEQEPPSAVDIFGERIDKARQFTAALADEGETRGLIGPQELPRLWTRHILNSAVAAPLFSGTVADVGSGAGLPGLVLAIARPDVQWILIEPMERRVAWLSEQVTHLGLDNVEIVRSRAEEWARGAVCDAVTARAVSALRTLVPLTAPLVRDGGELILLKGANAAREIAAAEKQIRRFQLTNVRVELIGEGVISEPTRVIRATVR